MPTCCRNAGAAFRSRQCHIGDCTRDASIAVIKGMKSHKPQVRERRFHHRVPVRVGVKPPEKRSGFFMEPPGRRCFEVDLLAVQWTRDHLHRAGAVVAPTACLDLAQSAVAGREQRCLPAEHPARGERMIILTRCVQHHFHHALHAAVSRFERADVYSQLARDRRADLLGIQAFSFDLAALQHVGSKSLEHRFCPKRKSERFHVSDQPALAQTHSRQRLRQPVPIPLEAGPISQIVDEYSPHPLR